MVLIIIIDWGCLGKLAMVSQSEVTLPVIETSKFPSINFPICCNAPPTVLTTPDGVAVNASDTGVKLLFNAVIASQTVISRLRAALKTFSSRMAISPVSRIYSCESHTGRRPAADSQNRSFGRQNECEYRASQRKRA